MIIHAIGDLHGFLPSLPGGDLLIIAGDLTAMDTIYEYLKFNKWLSSQDYKIKIVIAGNHDNSCKEGVSVQNLKGEIINTVPVLADKAIYLCNSGKEYDGLKIWGSPNSLLFHGVNPKCKAFMKTEKQLQQKYKKIPSDIDILITHTPPYGILDENKKGEHCGSVTLRNLVLSRDRFPNLKAHFFGHLHEQGGKIFDSGLTKFVNCSHVNEHYEPVNDYMEIEI